MESYLSVILRHVIPIYCWKNLRKNGWIIKFGENKKAQKIGKAQGIT